MSERFHARSRMTRAVSLCALAVLSACGGGGGGSSDPSAPPLSAFEQSRVTFRDFKSSCLLDCDVMVTNAHIGDDGDFTILWFETGLSNESGYHIGSSALGQQAVRSQGVLSKDTWYGLPRLLPLGNKRFAAVFHSVVSMGSWASVVADMSPSENARIAPRTVMPLTESDYVVDGPDGVFALGPNVVAGSIDLGGGAIAQGVPVPLPSDWYLPLWQTFQMANAVTPRAWWVVNVARKDVGERHIYLTSVDLSTGAIGALEQRSAKPWRTQEGCHSYSTWEDWYVPLRVQSLEPNVVATAWQEANEYANGCNLFVDGVMLNEPTVVTDEGLALGGSSEGPVVVWGEHRPGTYGQHRLVWSRRDRTTNSWTPPAVIADSQRDAFMVSSANGPGGSLVVAWQDCCSRYLSKYVDRTWTTQTLPASVNWSSWPPRLAINARGQAVVAWASFLNECSPGSSQRCTQVKAYRF